MKYPMKYVELTHVLSQDGTKFYHPMLVPVGQFSVVGPPPEQGGCLIILNGSNTGLVIDEPYEKVCEIISSLCDVTRLPGEE
jgi:hypothetical protein